MESRTIFVALRDALATLYPEEQSARVIVDDAGLPTLKIAFSSRAETNWHNILATAIHQNRVEALLQIVLSAYSTNVPLLSACGQYYHFISQGGRLEAPEQLPTSAATVQSIKTEGGTAVVGEVNTRGGTFVGRDQHNVNITIQSTLANDPTSNKLRSIVPKPPTDFVPRPTEYNALKELLLADSNAPVGITAAIRGAGGYGKTTLAQALCHDSAIIERFPDGIFWVELAQEPGELTGRVLNLVENLIDRRPGSTTLDAATSELIKAFGDKKLLLVIDDVWQAAHVAPFLQGGTHCMRLITTRINSLLPPEAVRVNVDAMQSGEATQLLGAGIRNVGDALDKLAKRLGEWPLLLRIMNAVLRERIGLSQDLKEAIADVNQELTEEGLGAFQNTASPSERHVSVTATLSVSLRRLPDLDRQRYHQLAIFPEDVDIPLITVAQLWGVSPREAKKLCFRLADLSLLLRFDLVTNTIRLHDVIRSYLCQAQANLAELHRIFLDGYKLADWTALPTDEPYLWDRLAYHLIEAKRTEELTCFFADDRWLQVRVAHDGYLYDGYIADLNQSWQQIHTTVQQQIEAGQMPTKLAHSVHHALIQTSINSLSSNYEPALVARATTIGLWSPERALSTAYKVSDAQKRIAMISAILYTHQCSEQQCAVAQTVALAATLAIRDERDKVTALTKLAPHLSGEQKGEVLTRALAAALAIEDERDKATALTKLVPHLNGKQKGEVLTCALAAALAIEDERDKTTALTALVPHLNGKQKGEVLPRALAATLAIEDERDKATALTALVPYLSGEALQRALAAALAIRYGWSQATTLTGLAPHLSDDTMQRVLVATLAIRDERDKAPPLSRLVPYLIGEQRRRVLPSALAAALAIEDERDKATALTALVPYLSGEQKGEVLPRALAATLAIEDERDKATALIELAPHLSGQALQRALAATLAIRDERDKAATLIELAPYLSGQALQRALAAALAIENVEYYEEEHVRYRAAALTKLVPHLSGEQKGEVLPRALAAALAIRDERDKVTALTKLAPHLSGDTMQRALAATLAIEDERDKATALSRLVPHLNGEQKGEVLPRALAAALAIRDERDKATTLSRLVPHLNGKQKGEVLPRALAAALAIEDERDKATALTALVPYLSGEALQRALAAALAIRYGWSQATTLTGLAPHLSSNTMQRALAAVLTIRDERDKAIALSRLVPYLSSDTMQRALVAVLAIKDEGSKVIALTGLAPYLSSDTMQRALVAVLAIKDEGSKVIALTGLAPYLSGDTMQRALTAVLAIKNNEDKATALAKFLPYISKQSGLPYTIHKTIADHLWKNLPTQQRQAVLQFLAAESLFEPPIIDQNILAAIARSISEVCFEWRWL